jgi:uncharacterized membrane protein YbhN (UPF0104 family)
VSTRGVHRLLFVACVCALAALGLMTWQLFDPRVLAVIVAMSAGQVLGTASFTVFAYIVFADLRTQRRARRASPRAR